MSCPDPDRLAALPTLTSAARAAIVDHAAGCEVCYEIVAELLPHDPAMAETQTEERSAIPPESAAPVAQIDRYQIVRKLGAGAMGVVYAAHDPELARPVAVKVLRAGGSADRMRREAQALAKLAHENVVAVYDVGEHAGSMFVAMALVDGQNLRAWLEQPHSTEQILDAMVQAGRGVEAAHAAGIVHRDLKPDNIFVGASGEVLVGDFGLARSGGDPMETSDPAGSINDLTATGTILGTPAYMAPEQLGGEASQASDQFALCVTAWEALYGERPYNAATIDRLVDAFKRDVPRTPDQPKLPAHVRAALRRGLAIDPGDRFPSVSALLAELRPRRRRWPYAVAAIALAGLGVTAFAITRGPSLDDKLAECATREGPAAWTAAARARLSPIAATIADRYAEEWKATSRAACEAGVRNEPAAPAIEHCLARAETTLRSVLEITGMPDLQKFLEYLEPAGNCLAAPPTPPPTGELAIFQGDLDRATVMALSDQAVDARPYVERANTFSDEATRAEAYYLLAITQYSHNENAEPTLVSTIQHADLARDDRIRTRATAMRAAVAARAGRNADAATQLDLARSAAARGNDPVAADLVEHAAMHIARAKDDLPGELRALRANEALLVARFGDESTRAAAVRFVLGTKLQIAKDPAGDALVDHALATVQRVDPSARDMVAGMKETLPVRRVPVDKQLVAIARAAKSPDLVNHLSGLAFDCFLISDYECALESVTEAIELNEPSQAREDLFDDAAYWSLESALATADQDRRTKRLAQSLAFIDRMTPASRDRDSAQATRGRVLLAQGKPREAIAPLSMSVDAAERAEPRHAFRLLVRSFALAQALWQSGGKLERDRARALVDQATAEVPATREMYRGEMYAGAMGRVERIIADLAAWKRTHQ